MTTAEIKPMKLTEEYSFKIDFELELILDINYAMLSYDFNIFQWEDGNKSIIDDYYDLFGSYDSIDQSIKLAETICSAIKLAKEKISERINL